LSAFLAAARRHDLFFVAARMAAPIVAALAPGDATKQAAPLFIRALIAADRVKEVAPWLPLLDANATDPLVAIVHAIDGGRADDKATDEALAALTLRANDPARQIGLFLMLATEFGTPPSASDLAAQMVPAHRAALPSMAVWLDLQHAESAHSLGGTLLAALALVESGPHVADEPILLQRALTALRAAGFDAEARGIARDAAVAGVL
jgi:hypothetical protein